MTERIPHIYSYTSAVNTGRPVHPMCAAMAMPPAAGESAPISPEVPQAPVEGRKENQDTITDWANDTFGPSDSNIRIAARANEEMAELLRALSADDDNPKAAEEIADVVIVLYRVASRLGYDLHELIDKKMEINRGREWKLDNTGHGYHVRATSETTPATPSAAVGASEPGAGGTDNLLPCPFCGESPDTNKWRGESLRNHESTDWHEVKCRKCDFEMQECENIEALTARWNRRVASGDTVPRAEYDRVVKLNHHLREVAVMAIVERVPSDSKPSNSINPESEDTLPHNPVLGPVVGTATVTFHDQSKTVPPEVGKQYVCRNGDVTDAMTDDGGPAYPFLTRVEGVLRSWKGDGRHDESKISEYDLIAEYHEPEPSPPAESPEDWVPLTDPKHTIRRVDECQKIDDDNSVWTPCCASVGGTIEVWPELQFRCRRKDLPVVPVDKPRMRQVLLREYYTRGYVFWSSDHEIDNQLSRTCVTEVPE